MKYEAHRGVGTEFPENTIPAFLGASAQGYDYIELDTQFTKDHKLIVFHDNTINRVCRYNNGDVIKEPIEISNTNYSELLEFDAGISKAPKFAGTKIPLLSDVLKLAKDTGLTIKLDNRIQNYSDEETEIFFDTIKSCNAKVSFTSSLPQYIKKVAKYFPNAEIHYDGYADEEQIRYICSILNNNPLTVWLPLQSPLTSWVSLPYANETLCKTVKKYANLGVWLLNSEEELQIAEQYGADVIETTGTLKPVKKANGAFDCHTHTKFSHDSDCDPNDSFKSAKGKGLSAFAITDHCDIEFYKRDDIKSPIIESAKTTHSFSKFVISGVEFGEALWHNEIANGIIDSEKFDIILGSVHAAQYQEYTMPFSQINFSLFTEEKIKEYLKTYFTDLSEMIDCCNFDVLSHLTNPLKYICGKYHFKVDLDEYREIIDEILKKIICRGIALEINTSSLRTAENDYMPRQEIIARYKELGGYLVTLGSDAHTADNIADNFDKAISVLLELGFKNAYYYINRTPIQYSLEDLK